ncbi:heat shock factor protein 1-like isoform X1, partial [Dinothrombium tinctorium]
MHSNEKGAVNVPAFLIKLWKIVEDPAYDQHICWSANGKSFIIRNQSQFSKELLPLFFKHNNMASFIRQLNMYGFRKLTSIEHSGLRTMDKDEVEFYHQYFIKGHENLLEMIKRKANTGPCVSEDSKKKSDDYSGILMEVQDMKGRQESVDLELSKMQQENAALWREIAILRQKYQKQQQIVEKLIQFLLSMVQNRGIVGVKINKGPLMIHGVNDKETSDSAKIKVIPSTSGPVIHDITDIVTDAELTENLPNFVNLENASPPEAEENTAPPSNSNVDLEISNLENPSNVVSEILDPLDMLDPLQSVVNETLITPDLDFQTISSDNDNNSSNVNFKDADTKSVSILNTPSPLNTPPGSPAAPSPSKEAPKSEGLDLVPSNSNSLEKCSNQLEGIETELGWLQEQLSMGNFSIDSNSLLG